MNLANLLTVESLSNTFILLLTKITAILVVAWLSHLVLRRSNPRWRILVWRVSVVGLIGTVLLSLLSPLFTLRLLPAISAPSDATHSISTANPVAPFVGIDGALPTDFATNPPNTSPPPQQQASAVMQNPTKPMCDKPSILLLRAVQVFCTTQSYCLTLCATSLMPLKSEPSLPMRLPICRGMICAGILPCTLSPCCSGSIHSPGVFAWLMPMRATNVVMPLLPIACKTPKVMASYWRE